MFYTYILKSRINGSYYVGSCEHVNKRIGLHNKGLVKSTKRLIHKEDFLTYNEARKRELQIKSWKKRSAIEN